MHERNNHARPARRAAGGQPEVFRANSADRMWTGRGAECRTGSNLTSKKSAITARTTEGKAHQNRRARQPEPGGSLARRPSGQPGGRAGAGGRAGGRAGGEPEVFCTSPGDQNQLMGGSRRDSKEERTHQKGSWGSGQNLDTPHHRLASSACGSLRGTPCNALRDPCATVFQRMPLYLAWTGNQSTKVVEAWMDAIAQHKLNICAAHACSTEHL